MGQACEVCGKKPVKGNKVTHRGKAKYLGGVGTKITGISPRRFRPNLQKVHVTASGTNKTLARLHAVHSQRRGDEEDSRRPVPACQDAAEK